MSRPNCFAGPESVMVPTGLWRTDHEQGRSCRDRTTSPREVRRARVRFGPPGNVRRSDGIEAIVPRPMSVPEREQFLSNVHVGVVSVNDDDGRAPLARPIWYRYERGGLVTILTGRDSRKARLIQGWVGSAGPFRRRLRLTAASLWRARARWWHSTTVWTVRKEERFTSTISA